MVRTGERITIRLLAIFWLASAALANGPTQTWPRAQKLDYFVGDWSSDGEMKPGPRGPGGKTHIDERAEWMEGGYFIVVHSKFTSAGMGNGSGIAFMGYDSQEKTYTFDESNSTGEAEHSRAP